MSGWVRIGHLHLSANPVGVGPGRAFALRAKSTKVRKVFETKNLGEPEEFLPAHRDSCTLENRFLRSRNLGVPEEILPAHRNSLLKPLFVLLPTPHMPYSDPHRQDLRTSAKPLLGPTPPAFALQCKSPTRTPPAIIFRQCRNLTETLQMPYSDPPDRILGGGGGGDKPPI